jgi:hypothetical protein
MHDTHIEQTASEIGQHASEILLVHNGVFSMAPGTFKCGTGSSEYREQKAAVGISRSPVLTTTVPVFLLRLYVAFRDVHFVRTRSTSTGMFISTTTMSYQEQVPGTCTGRTRADRM